MVIKRFVLTEHNEIFDLHTKNNKFYKYALHATSKNDGIVYSVLGTNHMSRPKIVASSDEKQDLIKIRNSK